MAGHNLAQALEEVEEALPEQAAMRLMAGQTVPIRAMAAPQLRVAALGQRGISRWGRLYLDRAAVAVPSCTLMNSSGHGWDGQVVLTYFPVNTRSAGVCDRLTARNRKEQSTMATYLDLANLANDASFLARIGYAIGKYASYIFQRRSRLANHAARLNWAVKATTNVPAMAATLVPKICQDTNVVAGLAAVTDANLQTGHGDRRQRTDRRAGKLRRPERPGERLDVPATCSKSPSPISRSTS